MFPPVGPENLIRLGEDLLHVLPIYREDGNENLGDEYVLLISNEVAWGKASLSGLSPRGATTLTRTFRKVPLLRQLSTKFLTPLVARPYQDMLPRVSVRTRGPDC